MFEIKRLVLSIENVHSTTCGNPPNIVHAKSVGSEQQPYCSYFENDYGEQWVLEFDRATRKGNLYGGDMGWENPVELVLNQHDTWEYGPFILGQSVILWMQACAFALRCPAVQCSRGEQYGFVTRTGGIRERAESDRRPYAVDVTDAAAKKLTE